MNPEITIVENSVVPSIVIETAKQGPVGPKPVLDVTAIGGSLKVTVDGEVTTELDVTGMITSTLNVETGIPGSDATYDSVSNTVTIPRGNSGSSAYEIAVAEGFVGTVDDWLDSLIATARDAADEFANAPRGVEVEPGKYSGRHYSLEAEESMNDAKNIAIGIGEQTLSDGTIGYSSKYYSEVSASLKSDIEVIQDDIEDDLSDVIKIVMNPEDSQYTLSDGLTAGYSAKHYHEKIIDLNAISLSNIAATNADVVLTHEDVRLTGLDVEATGADVLTTEAYMDLAEDYKNDALHLATNAKDAVVTLSNGIGTAYSARHYAEYAEIHKETAADMMTDAIKVSIFPIDTQYTLNDNTVDYSSKHYHAKTVIAKNAVDASVTAAATSAGLANTSAQAALLSQNAAATSASDAATILAQVSTIVDNFDDRYLGAKTEDPTLDNDGQALTIGSIYYNTTSSEVRFYDGATWDRPEYSASQSAIAADTSRANAVAAQVLSEAAKDIAVMKASEASGSAASAANSATIASEKAEAVSELFLGAKASDPATDNEGGTLLVGAIYYNISISAMKVWNGTTWQIAVFDTSGAVTTFNGRNGAVVLTGTDINTAIGVNISESLDSYNELILTNNIGRADKYLAQQAVANMIYTNGKLTKVRYNNDTDVEYETLTYGVVTGKLDNVAHYVAGELVGNTALSYTDGKLVSAIYTGV